MTTIVDGGALARTVREEAAAQFESAVATSGVTPLVAIVQLHGAESAEMYTRQLQRAFAAARVDVQVHELAADTSLDEAIRLVRTLSEDPAVHGVQIQTPLPPGLSLTDLTAALDPAKDLDGIHPQNLGLLAQGQPSVVPATPLGGLEILLRHGVDIVGAHAVVVGRSTSVGKPMALLLLQRHATVTICHTRTRDMASLVAQADILAVAAGRPGLVTAALIRPGAAVVDFGTNVVDGRVVGDVDPGAADRAGLFTPVPGGTGPMTTAMLVRNALGLYRRATGVEI